MKSNKKSKVREQKNSKQLGLGVMIQMLGGNEETVEAFKNAVGKKIVKAELDDDVIRIWFNKDKGIEIWDAGQSCCEHRYITTDDNPSDLKGKKLTNIEIADAPDGEGGEVHEVQFLRIHAEDEVVVFETHNEHNGYYGGFAVKIKEI